MYLIVPYGISVSGTWIGDIYIYLGLNCVIWKTDRYVDTHEHKTCLELINVEKKYFTSKWVGKEEKCLSQ